MTVLPVTTTAWSGMPSAFRAAAARAVGARCRSATALIIRRFTSSGYG